MKKQLPKSVKQIGNVSDNPKIYVEDYVDTFLTQLCDKDNQNPVLAALVGGYVEEEEQEYVYIFGAIRLEESKNQRKDGYIDDEMMKDARRAFGEYFEEGELIGCFCSRPGMDFTISPDLMRQHFKYFPKKNSILILRDHTENEEIYFAHKLKDLMEIGGHYIYYEKNTAMQNYMLAVRKMIGVTPSETLEDQAAKDFRDLVKARIEKQRQQNYFRIANAVKAGLVVMVLATGVVVIKNYDQTQAVQNSVENLTQQVASKNENQNAGDEDNGENAEGKESKDGENSQNSKTTKKDNQKNTSSAESDNQVGTSNSSEKEKQYYIVQKGDNLAKISQKLYGNPSHVDAICRMNGLKDGNLIFIGQKLLLP